MRLLITCLTIFLAGLAPYRGHGQEYATVRGRLVLGADARPLGGAQLFLPALRLLVTTDDSGSFIIEQLAPGAYTLLVRDQLDWLDSFRFIAAAPLTELGTLYTKMPADALTLAAANLQTALPSEQQSSADGDDETGLQQGSQLLLHAARAPFLNTSGFIWSSYGFRNRGYARYSPVIFINGISMNDPGTGNPLWSSWGGLNDAFRNVQLSYGLSTSSSGIGNICGINVYSIAAQEQNRQLRCSYALSNSNYHHRFMLAYTSGIRPRGWAFQLNASARHAEESYRPGTSFRSWSLLGSCSKQWNSGQELSLTFFAAPTMRSRYAGLTDEQVALSGDTYYNPNWGWQNGYKRNARTVTISLPTFILQHQYDISGRLSLRSSAGFRYGLVRQSGLDWYKAPDPRPDYYRNLPSHYRDQPAAADAIRQLLREEPARMQLNWDRFYQVNRNNYEQLNGSAPYTGNRSLYVLAEDCEAVRRYSFSSQLSYRLQGLSILQGGLHLCRQQTTCYRQLADLLGGDYFVNYNQFAEQQYNGNQLLIQSDLDHPDRAIREGDQYQYAYRMQSIQAESWLQLNLHLRKLTLMLGAQGGLTAYQREGLYRNGLFPAASYGKSSTFQFLNYRAKAGMTYTINGRHYLFAHAFAAQSDPGSNQVFLSPRTRHQSVTGLRQEITRSMEAGYLMKAPAVQISFTGYATAVQGSTVIQRFYNDDPSFQGFVNLVMQQVDTRFTGIEFAAVYAFSTAFSLKATAAAGQAFYTNRPVSSLYRDNDTLSTPEPKAVFLKNYYLGVGPQTAYAFGLQYNSRHHGYLQLTASYLDRNYVAVNPARRSPEAAGLLKPGDPVFARIFGQERLPAIISLDLSAGQSFRLGKLHRLLPDRLMLYLNLGINNLLGSTRMKSGGYEQLRYDYAANNPDKFPSRYFYVPGRNFFLQFNIRQ